MILRKCNCLLTTALLFVMVLQGTVMFAQPLELQIEQTIDPTTVSTRGSGQPPESAAVKIVLHGLPMPAKPIDLVFVVDRSASANLTNVRKIGKEFLHHLSEGDRIALVTLAETAELGLKLTEDRAQAHQFLDEVKPGKQTALGEALVLAIDELLNNGRSDAFRAIVLPTDGNSLIGRLPLSEAKRAGANKIPIYSLGINGAVNRSMLSQIATASSGAFFGTYSPQVYEGILKKLGRAAVARFLRVTVTLPSQIIFDSAFEPAQVRQGARGATVLEWDLPVVVTGEARTVMFQIGAYQGGSVDIGQAPSLVEYRDAQNKPQKQNIPSVALIVTKVNKPPYAAFRFSPSLPRANDKVCFDATDSLDPDGKIVQYEWDWEGDGAFDETTTETRICHTFTTGGSFNVTLRVTDEDTATTQNSQTVTVSGSPGIPMARFTFSPANPGAGDKVSFDASASQSGNGEIRQYEWDWNGDGAFDETTATPTAQHIFSDSGKRKVVLRVTNSQGQSATYTAVITVTGRVPSGFDINSLATTSFTGGEMISLHPWLNYYTRDGVVSDEELKDAATRFGIGVYVPGTRYLLTQQDLESLNHLNYSYRTFVRYRESSAAEAEGYRPLGSAVLGLGQAYVSEKVLNQPLALSAPPILLYEREKLVGVRYVAFEPDEGSLFGYRVESWPKAGEAFILTIWLVSNPNGPFAASNPNVR